MPRRSCQRRRCYSAGLAVLTLCALSQPAAEGAGDAPPPEAQRTEWLRHWDEGVRLEWESERLKLRVGGKAMGDIGWVCGDDVRDTSGAAVKDGDEWRRLRPFLSGTAWGRLDFKLEGEFAGPGTRWMDIYVRLRDLPHVGSATAGHFKEPFGLEQLTSSAHTTFLERALPDAFTPGRSLGVMLHNTFLDERATWSLGLFRSLADKDCFPSGRGGEACALTGRGTWLAWENEGGNALLHLGAAYSYRRLHGQARYRQRPETHFLEHLTDTGRFRADNTHLFGAEAAWVRGPLSLQGEYMAACADRPSNGNAFLHGFYIQASYLLTGEHRPYNRANGIFKDPKPSEPFPTKGLGAWELAARYSFLDLDGPGLADSARQVQDFTIGLNWYLNPNLRVGWNYVRSWSEGPGGCDPADIFLLRAQLAF